MLGLQQESATLRKARWLAGVAADKTSVIIRNYNMLIATKIRLKCLGLLMKTVFNVTSQKQKGKTRRTKFHFGGIYTSKGPLPTAGASFFWYTYPLLLP